MPVDTTAISQGQITLHTASGRIDRPEVLAALDEFYTDDSLPSLVLWDFSNVDEVALTAADVEIIARYPLKYRSSGQLKGGRRAILAPTDLGFGLSRMLDTIKELTPELSSYRTRAFRGRDEAVAWLEQADGGIERGS